MKLSYFFVLIIPLLLLTASCNYNKEPDFVNMENVRITKLNADQITIEADAKYFNSNDVGCVLVKTDVDVTVDDILVGHIVQTKNSDIGAKSEFLIPMKISFETKTILKDKLQLLQGILGALGNKKVDVRYRGTTTVDIFGIDYESKLDYTEAIPLKKSK